MLFTLLFIQTETNTPEIRVPPPTACDQGTYAVAAGRRGAEDFCFEPLDRRRRSYDRSSLAIAHWHLAGFLSSACRLIAACVGKEGKPRLASVVAPFLMQVVFSCCG